MSAARRCWILAFALGCGLALGCDPEPLALCGEIPTDGCPLGRGGTCDDPFCAALYDCVDGAWTLAETCAADGGGGAGGAATGGSGAGLGGCTPVSFDHTGEVPGCTPDLQSPDCPAEAAEDACDPCSTGCIDFFLCTASGWQDVATCTDAGELVVLQGM